MKKPKLKLGRPVLAGDTEPLLFKGKYLYPAMDGHYVLSKYNNQTRYYYKVKPDLSAPPMNGDIVEVSNSNKVYNSDLCRYIGQREDGFHMVEKDHLSAIYQYARHPQQSKREKIHTVLEKGYAPIDTEDLVDEILKIMEEK